jgi:hypothetical protein
VQVEARARINRDTLARHDHGGMLSKTSCLVQAVLGTRGRQCEHEGKRRQIQGLNGFHLGSFLE